MIRLISLIPLALLAFPVAAVDEPITKPIRFTWIASSCETWNCAAAALVLADGSKDVIVLPTGREELPWLILRRVEEGSIVIPDEEPYRCDLYESTLAAATQFKSLDECRSPLMLSVPDGRVVIASISDCTAISKRRAVSR